MATGAVKGTRGGKLLRANVQGLAWTSPWMLGFLAFTLYPILASLYYSFTRYDVIRRPRFIGLQNYAQLLTKDPMFRTVMANTLYWVLIGVPAAMTVAFLLASLLNSEMRFRPLFRTFFFVPSIVPVVASAMVWMWVLNVRYGVLNTFIASLGLQAIPFLSSPTWAKPSLIMITCWAQGGTMVIFLAALQDVPRSLYEAARVDGAGRWARFRHITVPMCTPSILFVVIMGLIDAFQYFSFAWLLTGGGPLSSTEFFGIYLYRNAFVFFKMGYASALAWILFVIIVGLTMLVFRTSARWVYYGGSSD